MKELFFECGPLGMAILTLELIGLILAAWKAPAWVTEIGLIALVTGFIWTGTGFIQAAGVVYDCGGTISPALIWKGMQISAIGVIYGAMIYMVSLVLRIIQKPRI